jgi:hypothetical protein
MITQESIARKIVAFLNGEVSETDLVHWAETAFVELSEADADIPNEAGLLDILGYLGAGDTPGFPLTWSALSDFLDELGVKVRVIAEH